MNASRITKLIACLCFGLPLAASLPTKVDAQASNAAHDDAVRNIVLVHGAWANGSSWSRVIPLFEARGFHVVAAQMPLTSLQDDDVAGLQRRLDEPGIGMQRQPDLAVDDAPDLHAPEDPGHLSAPASATWKRPLGPPGFLTDSKVALGDRIHMRFFADVDGRFFAMLVCYHWLHI